MLKNERYGIAADWWSFGCVLFELLTGKRLFSSKRDPEMDRNQCTLEWKIKLPKKIIPDAKDREVYGVWRKGEVEPERKFPKSAASLILSLLERDPSKRLCVFSSESPLLLHLAREDESKRREVSSLQPPVMPAGFFVMMDQDQVPELKLECIDVAFHADEELDAKIKSEIQRTWGSLFKGCFGPRTPAKALDMAKSESRRRELGGASVSAATPAGKNQDTITGHKYFKKVKWELVRQGTVKVPWVPESGKLQVPSGFLKLYYGIRRHGALTTDAVAIH